MLLFCKYLKKNKQTNKTKSFKWGGGGGGRRSEAAPTLNISNFQTVKVITTKFGNFPKIYLGTSTLTFPWQQYFDRDTFAKLRLR